MVDLLIKNGTVVTVNCNREVIEDGAVAIDGDTIVAVGPTDEIENQYDAKQVIDATNHAVFPGFINAHTHVSDILLRGGFGADRKLFDWLYNVKYPGDRAMNAEEHALASALYCQEAIQSGITTFVENAGGKGVGFSRDIVKSKLNVYDIAGMRNVYAQTFEDGRLDSDFKDLLELQMAKEPSVNRVPLEEEIIDTKEAFQIIESLIKEYNGSADGRQSVWPAPLYPRMVTPEGFKRAYELAEKYDVMTTTHTSITHHTDRPLFSDIEYLNTIGYLGKHSLLNHCVDLNECDIRLLSATDTRVSHNPVSNLALGVGFAPIPTMIRYGVTVGIGTDDASINDTVNMVNDIRFAALREGKRIGIPRVWKESRYRYVGSSVYTSNTSPKRRFSYRLPSSGFRGRYRYM